MLKVIDSARKLAAESLAKADVDPLPAQRKFVEMNALLQKSLPEELQPQVLEIGTAATEFFRAVSDKEPTARELHAKLDKTLEKLAGSLGPRK